MYEKPIDAQKTLEKAQGVCEKIEQAYCEGDYKDALKRIFQPFAQVDYKKEKVELIEDENKFSFSKVEASEQDLELISVYIKTMETKWGINDSLIGSSDWYVIDQLNYSLEGNNFDIFSLLPKGYKILFCPDSEINTGSVLCEKQTIFIEGDLASSGALATILHEIGHVKDRENISEECEIGFVGGGTYIQNIETEKLRKEREASFFAMREMELLLRNNSQLKSDITLFLKDIAYYSYCKLSIKNLAYEESASSDFRDDMLEYEYTNEEYEGYLNIGAWLKFKESSEYAEWKKIDKFALLDEFDEFDEWYDWIVETGKIDDEKFYERYFK